MIKFVIRSTHGDLYYVGLNGLEIYEVGGRKVILTPDQIHATPFRLESLLVKNQPIFSSVRDVNDLPEIKKIGRDERCLENLIEPTNDTFNDRLLLNYKCIWFSIEFEII